MLSLLEVKCPHCGTRGQIMLPPMGSIIVGPCPKCQEMVAIFCGQVLPLEKDMMMEGSLEEQRNHLMSVLTEFVKERVSQLEVDSSIVKVSPEDIERADSFEADDGCVLGNPEVRGARNDDREEDAISGEEMDHFIKVDLRLLDNEDYFKSIFG